MIGIMIEDMHIRDERTLEFVKGKIRESEGAAVLTYDQIAAAMHCHRNTAMAIISRLEGAGELKIRKRGAGRGHFYEENNSN